MTQAASANGLGRWVKRIGRAFARSSSRPEAMGVVSERAAAYRVLGLAPGAEARQIRLAFRRLAAVHHPDRHRFATPAERAAMNRRFSEITAAYHALVS